MTLEWVINYSFEFLIVTTIGYLFRSSVVAKKQYQATQAGVKALLRDRLISAIDKAKQQGFIYVHELENINELNKEYMSLGGNGTVKHLMREIEKLPTKTSLI